MRLCLITFCILFVVTSSLAQWKKPPKNLQVFPKDITTQELRARMLDFCDALGVDCIGCHVAPMGKSNLSSYKFSSDEKETKRIARKMILMVSSINANLKNLGRKKTVEVTCMTCHRGYKKGQTLGQVLMEELEQNGIDGAVQKYHELQKGGWGTGTFDFGGVALNNMGYKLLGEKKMEEAIEIFRLNVKMHPQDANRYDSLAEAYLLTGNKRLALIYYTKALELNSESRRVLKIVEKLEKELMK